MLSYNPTKLQKIYHTGKAPTETTKNQVKKYFGLTLIKLSHKQNQTKECGILKLLKTRQQQKSKQNNYVQNCSIHEKHQNTHTTKCSPVLIVGFSMIE